MAPRSKTSQVLSAREKQMQDLLALAGRIERESRNELGTGRERKSKWGLPAHKITSFNEYPPEIQRLQRTVNRLDALMLDALDAYEAGLIDKETYRKEIDRIAPKFRLAHDRVRRRLDVLENRAAGKKKTPNPRIFPAPRKRKKHRR